MRFILMTFLILSAVLTCDAWFFEGVKKYLYDVPYEQSALLVQKMHDWISPCKARSAAQIEEGLDELFQTVFGQHIVSPQVKWAVVNHFKTQHHDHALSMVFLGSTGTGKNYVSRMIEKAVHGGNSKYYSKYYTGRLDFPYAQHVDSYRERLQREVEASVKSCPQSIFIFDEIDKIPAGVIDALKPYLDYHPIIRGIDFKQAVFIFLTNWGSKEINTIYLELRNQGLARESMKISHFENSLRHSLYGNSGGAFQDSDLIKDFLISHYLPFLPLDTSHVTECIKWENFKNNYKLTPGQVQRILSKMEFYEGLSLSGCKRVSDLVAVESYRRDEF